MMKRFTTYIVPMLALAVSACSSETTPVPDEPARQPRPDEVTLVLDVSINGGTASTRADGDPDRYDPASGEFEYIDGLRVLIVRGIEKDETTGKETGIIEGNRLVATDAQGNPLYDNLEFKVQANEDKRIYLIANERFLTPPNSTATAWNEKAGSEVSKFLDSFLVTKINEEAKRFDISVLNDWTVNIQPRLVGEKSSVRLPLTEFFNVSVGSRDAAVDGRWFSHLFLTRTAAKTRFFLTTSDNFEPEEGVFYNRITALRITGLGTKEYVFPNNAEYAPKTKSELIKSGPDNTAKLDDAYIKEFETPDGNTLYTFETRDVNVEIKKPVSGTNNPYFGNKPIVPITPAPLYFGESILSENEKYMVEVQVNGDEWFSAPLETNILSVSGKDAIARNTFLPILIEFESVGKFTVQVLPWQREDHYVDFTANVGITNEGCLSFEGTSGQTGDYLSLDKLSAQLVLNYGKVATGKFTIASPVGYTWDAYLITTGGTQDAIQFQIPNPEYKSETETPNAPKTITTTHLSGEIGKPVEFGIVSTVAPGAEQNSAQLIVMATLATGTQVIVDLLKNWESGNPGILTIIQNEI